VRGSFLTSIALSLTLLGLLLSGCSSSVSAPSCQNPTPAEQSCNACSGSQCAAQVSAVTLSCVGYVACYEACDCSDAACIASCSSDVTSNPACLAAGNALTLCVELNCPASQCGITVDGSVDESACGPSGIVCGGTCVDPSTDTYHCGSCGNACAPATACVEGVCGCSLSYETLCEGSCVDEASDPYNCGACGVQCSGTESCVGGQCGCGAGATLCGGVCVNVMTDTANCGTCGNACPTAKYGGPITCESGACSCPAGKTRCGGAYCVDTATDPQNCGACGTVCAKATPECARGACIATPAPNCAPGGPGLANCGVSAESCCASADVTGGTFFRTYDTALPDAGPDAGAVIGPDGGATGEADPATVSTFRLDEYLVTVGRFRQFVTAWNQYTGYYPPAGSGVHTHLHGGNGLVALGVAAAVSDAGVADAAQVADATLMDGGAGGGVVFEQGWATSWNADVAPTDANLACNAKLATWTPTASTHETLPITCVTWQEAYAFCIWDGGFLPSEAEWEYAAAGGSAQLEYPWGSAPAGDTNQYAIYGNGAGDCYYPGGSLTACAGVSSIAPVGTASLGASVWGQLDMAGELQEWTLDAYAAFVDPSTDGAYLGSSPTRSLRGTNFGATLTPNVRNQVAPDHRYAWVGFRCARTP